MGIQQLRTTSLKTTAVLFACFATGHQSVSARQQPSLEEALRTEEISRRSATAFEEKWKKAMASDMEFETKLKAMEKELQAMDDFTDFECSVTITDTCLAMLESEASRGTL